MKASYFISLSFHPANTDDRIGVGFLWLGYALTCTHSGNTKSGGKLRERLLSRSFRANGMLSCLPSAFVHNSVQNSRRRAGRFPRLGSPGPGFDSSALNTFLCPKRHS